MKAATGRDSFSTLTLESPGPCLVHLGMYHFADARRTEWPNRIQIKDVANLSMWFDQGSEHECESGYELGSQQHFQVSCCTRITS